jgi:ERCC4-type nuclease
MTKEQVEVVIDVHEPPEITGAVSNHPDVESFRIDALPAADLEIEGVGFERKDIGDYVKSMKDGRLDRNNPDGQPYKLGERYDHAYILFDGDFSETDSPFKSDMDGEALRGHMASLTAREDSGVHAVIPVSNPALLADMAVRLARKHIEESDDKFIPQPVEDPDVDTTLQMYCCINGVGPTTAEKLKDDFPTMQDFVHNANYDSLQQVDGIGEKTAIRIIEEFIE